MSDPLAQPCDRKYRATYHGLERPLSAIRLLVLHDTEGDTAEGAARYFASDERTGSAHFCIDGDHCFRTLDPTVIAWGAPPANTHGLHFEQAGFAHWTREEWLATGVVERTAYRVAYWAHVLDIPLRYLTDAQLEAGVAAGVTYHAQVSRVFRESDHTDPGPHYPFDKFMITARNFLAMLEKGAQL